MRPPAPSRSTGFTLAEVAVTLIVVGIGLVFVLQGLNAAQFAAAQSHNRKVARELALITLGQIESGLFWEDLDERLVGNYAEEGYEAWEWEVALGDEPLSDEHGDQESSLLHDSYRYRDELARENGEDDDEEAEQPFEKVRIRVVFPKLGDYPNSITLERWIPWEQVHGPSEEDEQEAQAEAEQ